MVHPPEHAATHHEGLPLLPLQNDLVREVEEKLESHVIGGHIAVRVNAGADGSENVPFRKERGFCIAVKDFAISRFVAQSGSLLGAVQLVIGPPHLMKMGELVRSEVHAERL